MIQTTDTVAKFARFRLSLKSAVWKFRSSRRQEHAFHKALTVSSLGTWIVWCGFDVPYTRGGLYNSARQPYINLANDRRRYCGGTESSELPQVSFHFRSNLCSHFYNPEVKLTRWRDESELPERRGGISSKYTITSPTFNLKEQSNKGDIKLISKLNNLKMKV